MAGGNLSISGFKVGSDHLYLSGYGTSEQTSAIAGAAVSSAGTTLSLSDGTHITLSGVTGASSSLFG
jgi:hypothetical protein